MSQLNPGNQHITGAMSFANAARRGQRSVKPPIPTKHQGIILHINDTIPLEEYIYAIGELTEPSNIHYAGKLPNNRMCIYLKDKETAEFITQNYKVIKVNSIDTTIRPLITPSRRVIINVNATIPEELIINKIKEIGLKPTSEINYLRAGARKPGFEHVLGLRRYIYIELEENKPIPQFEDIYYENSLYRMFLTEDTERCTHCNKHGHKSELCRNIKNKQQVQNQEQNIPQIITSDQLQPEKAPNDKEIKDNNDIQPQIQPTSQEVQHTKRQFSELAESAESNDDDTLNRETNDTENKNGEGEEFVVVQKKIPKKPKRSLSPPTPIGEWLKPARHLFKRPAFIISYDQFHNFTERVYNHNSPLTVAREYTEDIQGLIQMMRELHTYTTNRSAKLRITQAINKIEQELTLKGKSDEESTDDPFSN